MTIRELYNYLDHIAPFNNQDKSDNAGLLVGDYDAQVKKILVCLDVTNKVVNEAVEKGIDLIISHHPLMYRPVRRIVSDDPLHALIRSNINFIAVHTNLDVAVNGLTDLMLEKLGFPKSDTVIRPINSDESGYGRIIDLDTPICAEELAEKCKVAFNCAIIRYVDSGKPLLRIGTVSGSAGESVEAALGAGCDAFICGEISHSGIVFAANHGMTLIEAGHFHTEDIFCEDIIKRIKSQFEGIDIEKSDNSVDFCKFL